VETVKDHYDSFLGQIYSWILGDFNTAYRNNIDLFDALQIIPKAGDIAVDLGCGPGCQSLPLAELGYKVLAIDFCQELLDELDGHAGDSGIRTICDDILNFQEHLDRPPDLIVCMGDTLVHLPDRKSVRSLINSACDALRPGGRFIYAIRDYINYVPTGAERFIPIRADEQQIFTCFLDYKDDVVHVHDILHREIDGEWHMDVSDYLKLRLNSGVLDQQLQERGMQIGHKSVVDHMIVTVADKPV